MLDREAKEEAEAGMAAAVVALAGEGGGGEEGVGVGAGEAARVIGNRMGMSPRRVAASKVRFFHLRCAWHFLSSWT